LECATSLSILRSGELRPSAWASGRAAQQFCRGRHIVLERPNELGGGEVTRFATVAASAGTLRLVARVGLRAETDTVEIAAWTITGSPYQCVLQKLEKPQTYV